MNRVVTATSFSSSQSIKSCPAHLISSIKKRLDGWRLKHQHAPHAKEKDHSSSASFLSCCLKALGWRLISLVPRPGAKGGCWVHLQHHGTQQSSSTIKMPDYILYSGKTSQFPTKSSSGPPGNSAWLEDEGQPGATTQIQVITETNLWSDIVLFSGKSKQVVMLERTVPWEESTLYDPWSGEQEDQNARPAVSWVSRERSAKLQKWQRRFQDGCESEGGQAMGYCFLDTDRELITPAWMKESEVERSQTPYDSRHYHWWCVQVYQEMYGAANTEVNENG